MAAPPEVTTLNLAGSFNMNKTLGDDPDEILRLQGVSWFKRKLIGSITITLYVKHYKDDEGKEHIDIEQVGTGGFKGNTERRITDWTFRHHDDPLFGPVVGKSQRVKIDELEYDWHKEGWTPDTLQDRLIESYVESDTEKSGTKWIAHQVWGFSIVNGERRYVRRIHFTGPEEEDIHRVLVYDYVGPNTQADE